MLIKEQKRSSIVHAVNIAVAFAGSGPDDPKKIIEVLESCYKKLKELHTEMESSK